MWLSLWDEKVLALFPLIKLKSELSQTEMHSDDRVHLTTKIEDGNYFGVVMQRMLKE